MSVLTELTIKMSTYFIRFSAELGPSNKILTTENNVFLCFSTQNKCYVYFVFDVLAQKKKKRKKESTHMYYIHLEPA